MTTSPGKIPEEGRWINPIMTSPEEVPEEGRWISPITTNPEEVPGEVPTERRVRPSPKTDGTRRAQVSTFD